MFLEISQNSQENTCARVFVNKVAGLGLQGLGHNLHSSEAVIQGGSYKKVFWKYAANLQENTHFEVLLFSKDKKTCEN